MTYKGMLLSALLVPVTVTSYGQDSVDSRIQQLKEARYQKELELSELGAKIDKIEEVVDDLRLRGNTYIQKLADDRGLSEQEFDLFLKEMNQSRTIFEEDLNRILENRESVKQRFVFEFLKSDNIVSEFLRDENGCFENVETLKIYLVREMFEKKFQETLLKKYETCLQELIDIDRELDVLQEEIL